jgi:hypothetical protein
LANPLPNVPLPVGAVRAEEWQPDGNRYYRTFWAEERRLGDAIEVWADGVQHDDGRIDDGSEARVFGPPAVRVAGLSWEDGMSSAAARHLADVLVMAADELDGWATR